MTETLIAKLNDLLNMYNEGVVLVVVVVFFSYLSVKLSKIFFTRENYKESHHIKEIENLTIKYEREISILTDLHKSKVTYIHKEHKKILRKLAVQIECTIEDHEKEIL